MADQNHNPPANEKKYLVTRARTALRFFTPKQRQRRQGIGRIESVWSKKGNYSVALHLKYTIHREDRNRGTGVVQHPQPRLDGING